MPSTGFALRVPGSRTIARRDVFAMYEKERLRASNIRIDGPQIEMAREVRHLLGWEVGSNRPYLSTRAASTKTHVNYSTIAYIARGYKSKAETLRAIAEGLNGDFSRLMRLAGYIPEGEIVKSLEVTGKNAHSNVVREEVADYQGQSKELEIGLVFDDGYEAGYDNDDGLTEEDRENLRQEAQDYYRFKAEQLRQQRQKQSQGLKRERK